MHNPLYDHAVTALQTLFGTPRPLVNKNGVRYLRNGSVTLYHEDIAPGNQAEIAINVPAVSARYGMPPPDLESLIADCRDSTARPVKKNKQQDWPRIGLATEEDLLLVLEKLAALQR